MKKVCISSLYIFLTSFIVAGTLLLSPLPATAESDPANKREITSKVGVIQLPFIKNESLTDTRVRYYANTLAGTTFVTDDGITYALRGKGQGSRVREPDGF